MSIPILVAFFSAFFAIIHAEIFIITRRLLHNDRIALCVTAFSVLLSVGFYQMMTFGQFPALVGVALTLGLLFFLFIYLIGGKRKLLLLGGTTLASSFLIYTLSSISALIFTILFFSRSLLFFERRKKALLGEP